jgi:hypothetical protein
MALLSSCKTHRSASRLLFQVIGTRWPGRLRSLAWGAVELRFLLPNSIPLVVPVAGALSGPAGYVGAITKGSGATAHIRRSPRLACDPTRPVVGPLKQETRTRFRQPRCRSALFPTYTGYLEQYDTPGATEYRRHGQSDFGGRRSAPGTCDRRQNLRARSGVRGAGGGGTIAQFSIVEGERI